MRRKLVIGCMIFLMSYTFFVASTIEAKGIHGGEESVYENLRVDVNQGGENHHRARAYLVSAQGEQQINQSGELEDSVKSEVVEQPEGSEELEVPEQPEGTEEPEVPELPEGSEQPEFPEQPEIPEEPEVPDEPEQPEVDPYDMDAKKWSKAYLSNTYITRGMTATYQLHLKKIPKETSSYSVVWKSSNRKIATVDQEGMVTAKKVGTAIIKCTIRTEAGYTKTFTCEFTVSNPRFTKEVYAVARNSKLQLPIKGTNTTKMEISSSNDERLKVYQSQKGLVKGKSTGKATVKVKIDGVSIKCRVVVTNPKVKKSLYVLTAREKATIQVYNQSGIHKVKYESKSPSVATVSKNGVITANKIGVAVILVTVDQRVIEVTVSVGHTKAVAAIKNAQRVLGATYSQPYRMRKGYYDCSSLVWRSYMPTGITFGYSKYAFNAPTAAGEAYYLVSRKKEIANTYVDERYLKPGDVVFISSGYNGRYRNITHVVIYIGNDIIIHATPRNGNCVQYGSYSSYKNMIVSIGRPVM